MQQIIKEMDTNILEINTEINDYQNFLNILKEYLSKNPNITFNDFKKELNKYMLKKNIIII